MCRITDVGTLAFLESAYSSSEEYEGYEPVLPIQNICIFQTKFRTAYRGLFMKNIEASFFTEQCPLAEPRFRTKVERKKKHQTYTESKTGEK